MVSRGSTSAVTNRRAGCHPAPRLLTAQLSSYLVDTTLVREADGIGHGFDYQVYLRRFALREDEQEEKNPFFVRHRDLEIGFHAVGIRGLGVQGIQQRSLVVNAHVGLSGGQLHARHLGLQLFH